MRVTRTLHGHVVLIQSLQLFETVGVSVSLVINPRPRGAPWYMDFSNDDRGVDFMSPSFFSVVVKDELIGND